MNFGSLIGHQVYSLEGALGHVKSALKRTTWFSKQFLKSKIPENSQS